MSDEENPPAEIPGRQVLLPSLLAALLLALLFSGISPSPKRYLYDEPGGAGHDLSSAPAANPGAVSVPESWMQDPLAVCTECHTAQEAEHFRKVIGPMLAAASGGWMNPAPLPEMLLAPLPATVPASAPMPPPDTALAGSK